MMEYWNNGISKTIAVQKGEGMSNVKVYPPSAAPEATRAQMPNEIQSPNVQILRHQYLWESRRNSAKHFNVPRVLILQFGRIAIADPPLYFENGSFPLPSCLRPFASPEHGRRVFS
jgi:hypothetical protein